MQWIRTIFITIILFFLFHQTSFSPVGQLASADDDTTANQMSVQTNWGEVVKGRSQSALLDVPVIQQLPELYNGCEVTSLSMLLYAIGKPVNKLELAGNLPKDPTKLTVSSQNVISSWGDPNVGFVGDMTGEARGYGVNSGPVYKLLSHYVPDLALDLTGKDFSALEWMIDKGSPVVVWTTTNFGPTEDWVSWKNGSQTIRVTFKEHVVLMVGYDDKYIYINDPLTGNKSEKILKDDFISSWQQLGKQALSVMGKKAMLALNE